MKRAWDEYWYGPVAAVRPYLLLKSFLFLLAFDCWLVTLDHGGKYGAGGFNVAHFGWLDAIQPLPSPGLYVGILLLSGILAFVLACTRPNRIALLVLFALYTYSWAMSMLDSYQHHYLVSLVLLLFAFFPAYTASEIFPAAVPPPSAPKTAKEPTKAKQKKQAREAAKIAAVGGHIVRTSAWAYGLVVFTCAVVYSWTAVSKTEPDWRAGHVLREITRVSKPLEPFETWFVEHGATIDGFWSMMGSSVILLQMVIALGYLLAPRRDTVSSKLMPIVCGIACLAALSFHVGAEYIKLRIGWFSWYMIAMALIAFLPATWLHWTGRALSWPMRAAADLWRRWSPAEAPAAMIGIAAGTAVVLVLMGMLVDVPGGLAAAILAGVALIAGAIWAAAIHQPARIRPYAVAAAAAGMLMWASIAASDVRWEFYRYLGGDSRRRGEIEVAIEAYEKAARYAPEGKWTKRRQERLEELRRRHAAGGTAGNDHGDE